MEKRLIMVSLIKVFSINLNVFSRTAQTHRPQQRSGARIQTRGRYMVNLTPHVCSVRAVPSRRSGAPAQRRTGSLQGEEFPLSLWRHGDPSNRWRRSAVTVATSTATRKYVLETGGGSTRMWLASGLETQNTHSVFNNQGRTSEKSKTRKGRESNSVSCRKIV